jgi:hypothetical protein
MAAKQISFDKISPSNFRVGDILSGSGNVQYVVSDVDDEGKTASIDQLSDDERVKSEFLNGSVQI